MRAPATSGRCATGFARRRGHPFAHQGTRTQARRVGAQRAQVAQPGEAVRAARSNGPTSTAAPSSPGRSRQTPPPDFQLALQQPRAAPRVARPGIAHRQGRRVGHPRHAQAGQPRDRPPRARAASFARSSATAPRRAARRSPRRNRRAPNTAVPATSVSAPASITWRRRRRRDPAIDRQRDRSGRTRRSSGAARRSLAVATARKSCPPNPGFTVITSMMSTRSSTHATRFERRCRVQHHAGRLPSERIELQRPVQMRSGLGMQQDVVRAGLGEGSDEGIDRGDHQMHVERQCASAGAAPVSIGGPKLMLGTKWPSMTSRCSQSAPAGLDRAHLLAQPREIGGEQAWRDSDSAGSRWRHATDVDRRHARTQGVGYRAIGGTRLR